MDMSAVPGICKFTQRKELEPLELELQMLWAAMWVLGSQPLSSAGAASAELALQSPAIYISSQFGFSLKFMDDLFSSYA